MINEEYRKLNPSEIFVVDWQRRKLGGFKTALAEAIQRADNTNLALLKLIFPDEVGGYEKFAHEDGWWEELSKRVGVDY